MTFYFYERRLQAHALLSVLARGDEQHTGPHWSWSGFRRRRRGIGRGPDEIPQPVHVRGQGGRRQVYSRLREGGLRY